MTRIALASYYATVEPTIVHRTLCFLLKDDKILLGRRKRGMGEGKYVGIGGRVETDETVEEAAVREIQEEVGVTPVLDGKIATVTFLFPYVDWPEAWNQQVHVFTSRSWTGHIGESDEIEPKWFDSDAIPYQNMWPDAPHWLPSILKGDALTGRFLYGQTGGIDEQDIIIHPTNTTHTTENGPVQ